MRDAEVVEFKMVISVGSLSSHEFCIFAQKRDNHILSAFDHAVGLGMSYTGCGVPNVKFCAQRLHFCVNVFRTEVCHE